MAKSALEIRLDYNKAKQQADSLSEIASEIRSTANNDLQDCISQISASWTGTNSTAYQAKCSTLKSNLLTTADKLEKTATTIRTIAKNTYNAEMAALEVAQLRNY
ncbi:MAG: WXG100 family type VII secretion target [Lachnospiraceae bacterium]|nr:WXG100 family type VII secretion target [Lachnospiraceae bacterium]